MLEYIKTILDKVSFDSQLFEKELSKAIKILTGAELHQLKTWCYEQFARVYRSILQRLFAHI